MMERKRMQRLFLAGAAALAFAVAAPVMAADPSLDQVYEAVHAGRLSEAESMMAQVLRDHPGSAKAHYVDAEVLAREGRLADAKAQLAQAEQLAPGLPFAKSESTEALRALIAGNPANRVSASVPEPRAGRDIAWGPLLLIGGAIVLLILLFRSRRRAAQMPMGGVGPAYGSGPIGPAYGPGPGPGYGPYGGQPYGGGGIGSGIVGGLATGAAVGAGMVAGQALAHDLMDGHAKTHPAPDWNDNAAPLAGNNDIDDRDFGIQDSGSWDDGGGSMGGGGDDWS